MGIEYEMKYRVTEPMLRQLRRAFPEEETLFSMETTYYDTPSGALAARHYTLRRRRENDIFVCTLKTPAAQGGRREIEVCAQDIQTALPELCKLSNDPELPQLLAEGIEPLCGAKFTRIAKTLTTPHNTLELALDEGILTGGGRELPFREVEVELKDGPWDTAQRFAQALALKFSLEEETRSKFYRAKLLAEGKGV